MIETNEDTYRGQWKEDFKYGEGRYTLANGKIQEGTFVNGEFSSKTSTEE